MLHHIGPSLLVIRIVRLAFSFLIFFVMSCRLVSILNMNGQLMDLQMPSKNVSCWDVMRSVKVATRIQMKEQKLIFDGAVLTPCDRIPNDIHITLTLIRVLPCCAYCKQEQDCQRTMFFCSGCLQVLYCNGDCQRIHWDEHREFCKSKIKDREMSAMIRNDRA